MATQLLHGRFHLLEHKAALLRDAVVFIAGAEAFHTLTHVWLGFSGMLPMHVSLVPFDVTQGVNAVAVVINALVTAGLLYGAKRLTK